MKKILVIEDDLPIQQVINDILENEGFKVFTANNGKAGINLAKEVVPDLIICDVMMPGIDGYSVLSHLSEDSETATIPFIYLSAKVEKNDIRRGMDLGADDYLLKPFKIDDLLKTVELRLKKKELLIEKYSDLLPAENHQKAAAETNEKIRGNSSIILDVKNQPKIVKIHSIKCITAFSEYSNVFLESNEKFLVRKLLKKWEEILPENQFFRIHRNAIINLNYIQKIEKWYNNSLAIFLKDIKEPFIVSRRNSPAFKSKLHYK